MQAGFRKSTGLFSSESPAKASSDTIQGEQHWDWTDFAKNYAFLDNSLPSAECVKLLKEILDNMQTQSSSSSPHDGNSHGETEHHHELGFWSKYVFSTDHKIIGIQYGVTGLIFLFLGFCLMMVMRWQLAHAGAPVPYIGGLLQTIFGPSALQHDEETSSGNLPL